ncbi:MAG: imidazole glycerol phosphate synthase subunit HisH [Microthrixaceae bacterium]
MGICVGMQMLYRASEEDPRRAGLGVFDRTVRRLPDTVKRPQMQWNRLDLVSRSHAMFRGLETLVDDEDRPVEPWVYFVHSFAAEPGPEVIATCDYGGPVTAAVARDRVWATQFHPEKSAATGLAILANFVAWVAAGAPTVPPAPAVAGRV